jgi:hypothetical protein
MEWPWTRARRRAIEAAVESATGELRQELHEAKAHMEGLLNSGDDIDGPNHSQFFRELRGGAFGMGRTRDLEHEQRRRTIGLAHTVYAFRPHGENLLDAQVDFILGDRLKPVASDKLEPKKREKLQTALDDVWADRRNALDDRHEPLTVSWMIEGELALGATLSAIDGHLEHAPMDPLAIKDVRQVRGRDVYLMVETDPNKEPERWFVLNALTPQIEIVPNESGTGATLVEESIDRAGVLGVDQVQVQGLAFFGAWNRPGLATRGRSDFTSVIDYVDQHDELVWSAAEIQSLKRWFLLWVKDPSIRTKEQARAVLKKLGLQSPPRNPKVLATNNQVELEVLNQQGNTEPDEWLAKELLTGIMGAKGMPEGWSGRMSDRGLAGARASDFLPLRRLRRKQRRVVAFWRTVVDTELELRRRAGVRTIPALEDRKFDMVALEVGGKDKQRAAEVLRATATALSQLLANSAVKPELANAVFVDLARELGVEIDAELEGVPEVQDADPGAAVDKMIRNLDTQFSRTDEGNQDEGDRDRREEGGRRAS